MKTVTAGTRFDLCIILMVMFVVLTAGSCDAIPQATTVAQKKARNWKLSTEQVQRIEKLVEQEMEQQKIVGMSIGILVNGKVVLTRSFGLADKLKKLPMTVDTVVNWASNSKPVIAVAAMQLVEKDQLSLEDDIRLYLPELPERDVVVRVRHLMDHSSGFPHYTNGKIVPLNGHNGGFDLEGLNPVKSIGAFGASPLLFSPDREQSYSSFAYVILSAVVQRAGGAPIHDQITQRIVRPLKLRSFQLDVMFDGQPHWATGYFKSVDGSIMATPEVAHGWKHGAGGYKSNIKDFARWAEALLTSGICSTKSRQRMWRTTSGKRGYGLGFHVDNSSGELIVAHNGGQPETRTRMELHPESGVGVVFMTNSSFIDPSPITARLIKAMR